MSNKRNSGKKPKMRLASLIPALIDEYDKMEESELERFPTIKVAVKKHRASKNILKSKPTLTSSSNSLSSTFKVKRLANSKEPIPSTAASKTFKVKRLKERSIPKATEVLTTPQFGTDSPIGSNENIKLNDAGRMHETCSNEDLSNARDIDVNIDTTDQDFEQSDVPSIETEESMSCSNELFSINVLSSVEDHICYEIELRKKKHLMVLDDKFTQVLVPDFNFKKICLKDISYVIIRRRSILNDDDTFSWVYSCSCSPFEASIIDSIDSTSGLNVDADLSFHVCTHVKAAKPIIEELSGCEAGFQDDIPLNATNEITQLTFDPSRLVVIHECSIGVIGSKQGHMRCFVCSSAYCEHVLYAKEVKERDDDSDIFSTFSEVNSEPSRKSRSNESISTKKIMFEPNDRIQYCLRNSVKDYLQHSENNSEVFICSDIDFLFCVECGGELNMGSYEKVDLLTLNSIFVCEVYKKRCTNESCMSVHEYDGGNDCILNMGKVLIHHSVMRDYMNHFLHGNSCTLSTFYEVWKLSQRSSGSLNFEKMISPAFWRNSWYSFLKLLDYNIAEASICNSCGVIPNVVVCDATSLGYQRRFATVALQEHDANTIAYPRYSEHKRRIAITSRPLREQFHLFISNRLNAKSRLSFLGNLKLYNRAMYNAVKWVVDIYRTESIPKGILEFFRCLSSSSPVCSYIYPSSYTCDLILRLCDTGVKSNVELLKAVQRYAPVFYNLLNCFKIESSIPVIFKGLFINLCDLALAPFLNAAKVTTKTVSNDTGLCRFPNLPKICERGLYEQDKESYRNPCRKNYVGHPRLMPGIFTLYCVHGICYGYQVMESQESPNIPFTIFKTRFTKAPSTIIYDNACSLHAYCLNRDPLFFKETLFVVDRFHWKNHTGCSPGYNINLYPQLKNVNSEINEQQNSSTKKLKTQLSYMNPDNFLNHCDFYIWYRNKLKKNKK